MSYYHLTWDAKTNKHKDVIEGLTELRCNPPYNVEWICRPVESTLVFWNPSAAGDVDVLYNAIRGKYKVDFDFILSRAAETVGPVGQAKHYIRGMGIKSHEDGYEDVLSRLKAQQRIGKDVKSLREYLV